MILALSNMALSEACCKLVNTVEPGTCTTVLITEVSLIFSGSITVT